MFAGPSIAGILMTGLVDGTAGFHDLRSRLIRWRVDGRWCVVAVLTAPLVVTAVLLPLSLSSAGFLPGVFATDDTAMLMHVSLTASTLILQPLDVAGMRALTYDLVLAAALWLLIAALATANGRQLSRPPLRPRVA